jgi:hypothetical protein
MGTIPRQVKTTRSALRGPIIALVCVYEVAAITSSNRIPTITRLSHTYRHTLAGKVVLGAALMWLINHIFVEIETGDPLFPDEQTPDNLMHRGWFL